jgi:hypothetical protein
MNQVGMKMRERPREGAAEVEGSTATAVSSSIRHGTTSTGEEELKLLIALAFLPIAQGRTAGIAVQHSTAQHRQYTAQHSTGSKTQHSIGSTA